MKLLIITQKVDVQDDVLGFFHHWIEEFSKRYEKVTVICLEKGHVHLPENVNVLSLGKENGASKVKYVIRFFKYIWKERRDYDTVFVHMNQEYVILGGIFWRLFGKKIGLWRNHPQGSGLTRIAVSLSNVVFCTSPYAFTAPFKKTSLMPVGIDTEEFRPIGGARVPDSILFFGRLAPIKKPEVLVDALVYLKQKNLLVTKTTFIGNAKSSDASYVDVLKKKIADENLSEYVVFRNGIPHHEAPATLSQFEVYVNATPAGSMDKAIFEAMACETIVIVSNKALSGEIPDELMFEDGNAESLGAAIERFLLKSSTEHRNLGKKLRDYVIKNHSLSALMEKLQHKLSIR